MMINSMTAFARCSQERSWGMAVWELRSVNHRFLEVFIRLPESWRDLEWTLRERLMTQMKRGKVECALKLQSSFSNELTINQNIVKQLANVGNSIQTIWPQVQLPHLMEVLNWPDVIIQHEKNTETIKLDILQLFDQVLSEAVAMREREGQALRQFIEHHLNSMDAHMEIIRARVPHVLKQQHNKLMERVKEFKLELNPERVEQEWLLLAQKMDITEELDRLLTHIKEMRRVLFQGGVVGRRLDFLTQELHREVNTLCSKSSDAQIAHSGVEMKVLIEQIREQVQNIE